MKKLIFSAILLMGCAALANAQFTTNHQTLVIEQVADEDGYKEIALTELGSVIQAAITTLAGDTCDVKKVELNVEKELTRVTLENKESKEVKCVILNKEGKEVKEEGSATAELSIIR